MEIRGFDANGANCYCWQFPIILKGAVDIEVTPIPIPEQIADKSFVLGITEGFRKDIDDIKNINDECKDNVQIISSNVDIISANLELAKVDISQISATLENFTPQGVDGLVDKINEISGNLETEKNKIDEHISNSVVHVTEIEKTNWNNKSNFNGNYDSLTNLPNLNIYELKENHDNDIESINTQLIAAGTEIGNLSDKIDEVSGKLPTSTGNSKAIEFISDSAHSFNANEDAGKLFFIDIPSTETINGDGLNPVYSNILSGQNLYAGISGMTSVTTTPPTYVSDRSNARNPLSSAVISGKIVGTNYEFHYDSKYHNTYFNYDLPVFKDKTTNNYLFAGKYYDGSSLSWGIGTVKPSGDADIEANVNLHTSEWFSLEGMWHPLDRDFNLGNWASGNPEGETNIQVTGVRTDRLSDLLKMKVDGTLKEFKISEEMFDYSNTDENLEYHFPSYKFRYDNGDDYILIYQSYEINGPWKSLVMKMTISENGVATSLGKNGSMALSSLTFKNLSGTYKDLTYLSDWGNPTFSHETRTLSDIEPNRFGEIEIPGSTSAVKTLTMVKIPIEFPVLLET